MNYLIRAAESKRLIVIWKIKVCNSKIVIFGPGDDTY